MRNCRICTTMNFCIIEDRIDEDQHRGKISKIFLKNDFRIYIILLNIGNHVSIVIVHKKYPHWEHLYLFICTSVRKSSQIFLFHSMLMRDYSM